MLLANMPNDPFAIGGRGRESGLIVVAGVDGELCESSTVCELGALW